MAWKCERWSIRGASVASQVAILLIHHDRLALRIITLAVRGDPWSIEFNQSRLFEEMTIVIINSQRREVSPMDNRKLEPFLVLCG